MTMIFTSRANALHLTMGVGGGGGPNQSYEDSGLPEGRAAEDKASLSFGRTSAGIVWCFWGSFITIGITIFYCGVLIAGLFLNFIKMSPHYRWEGRRIVWCVLWAF